MNRFVRILKHRWTDERDLARALDAATLARVEARVAASERRHSGEIRVCVEPSLPTSYVLKGLAARDRAIMMFGKLRVWDTEHNNGVLIYLLLADRRFEIVADRGIHRHVGNEGWEAIARQMERIFAEAPVCRCRRARGAGDQRASRAALPRRRDFHFHRGPDYAARYLAYDPDELAQLPTLATARFAGVGNPLMMTRVPAIGPLLPGQVALDHACGAGTALLLAARRVAPNGRAIGVDMTPGMRACAARAAEQAGLAKVVDVRAGVYEELPVADASVDVVISNGVVNLAPDKLQVFREIHRVLKPGGRLLLADVVVQPELNLAARSNPELWAACIGGALPESELHTVSAAAGVVDAHVTARFDSFRGTTAEHKVAQRLRSTDRKSSADETASDELIGANVLPLVLPNETVH